MLPQLAFSPPPEAPVDFGPIRFIPGRKGGRYPYCHSLVLEGEETWVVDPSSDKEVLKKLARRRRVSAVFLSHFHEDHQKYNYLFPEARFYVPAAELPAFTSIEAVFALAGVETPEFKSYLEETLVRDFHFRPLANLVPYQPGQRFRQGDLVLEIVAAPGHTPGHSCFFFPGQNLIFLADVDLTPFGPWYGDAASHLDVFDATLARLQEFRTEIYLTAHEQGIFDHSQAQAGLGYYRQVIRHRESRLLDLLAKPRTLKQLVGRRLIYGRPREPGFVYDHMEAQMLSKHLKRLQARGLVHLTSKDYWAST